MNNILANKENKGFSESIFLHGEIKLQRKGCFPCLVANLGVNFDYYFYGFGDFFENLAFYPPLALSSRSKTSVLEAKA